jgi:hypothetical protein
MNQAQRNPANRCFDSKMAAKQQEDQVKRLLAEAQERKNAEKQLKNLLMQFKGKKSLLHLLPVIKLRWPKAVLTLAIERIERKKDALPIDDLVFFENFKAELQS